MMDRSFVFLGLWFLACAGAAKFLAMAENMLHGFGWRRPRLQRIRGIHNALLVTYPIVTFVGLGLLGPQLLWEPDWNRWPAVAWAVFAVGWLGLIPLSISAWRYVTYQPPRQQVACQLRTADLKQRSPTSFVGTGRARWLARLPGNQQFSLEVAERTYELARLPSELSGLSLVHFSDVHFRGPVTKDYFVAVTQEIQQLQADLVLFTGDLLDQKSCLDWIPETLGKLTAPLGCYFVLGNHDWYLGFDHTIRQRLREFGWTDVAGRSLEIAHRGAHFRLLGNERPWMGTLPEPTPADGLFQILLSHGPDQLEWARRRGVDLMLAGHTHGGQIRLPILGPVYSPSVYDCRYASGVFWREPTLLHVSRGISGREPIRYNCRPEITKLILQAPRAASASSL